MEVLSAVVTQIAKLLVAPIGQWLCYSFEYDNNIKTMEDKLQTLELTRETVQHDVDAAIRAGEKIEDLVNAWLTKADETIVEARKIVQVEERAQLRCSNGACLDLKLRHQLSRKAKKIVEDVDEVLQEKDRFEKVSYRPALQGEVSRRRMDYMDFDSRMSTEKGLMEALGDANTNVIGVWGMAGAGKTTLVREVARKAKEKKLFDEVAIAYVTHSPDPRRIQGEIADMLDLKLDAETERGRAGRLKQILSGHKKTFVVLDDIWKKLDLEEIGIPRTECKVILTSRDKNLLSCEMGTQKDFGLGELPESEAWNLFQMMVGDCVKDSNLRCIATEVAKECAGLPIALVTVAQALKNKSLRVWKDALNQLRRPAPEHLKSMQKTIYSSIELSYSHLESPEVQYFFLLCAEMHYTITYRDLLKYCYGLGFFHGINSLEEASNRLYSHVRNLKDSCLLLDCPHGSDHCHMHDVVRDVATFIASRDHNMLVLRDNSGLKKWPDVDALKRCTAFSIRGGDIHELPNNMECPDLRFLYVTGGDRSLQIPETFFKGLGKLQVLDLTGMKLPSLPSSLGFLGKLQTLCLDQCVLEDIAIIGELKNLVVLSLLSSDLSQLPREIGLLTHLRLLDLSNCSKLEVIPPNVLSSLVELEELYIGNSFVQWEIEGPNSKRNNASLAELKHLPQLITLEIQITDVRSLPKDLSFEKLERYAISVGDHVWDSSNKHEASKALKLKLNMSFQLEVGIKMLLESVEDLYLDELKGVKSILNELDREGFQQVKHLHIQNNPEIKYVTNLRMPHVAFPALETFLLKNMTSLEEICHGQLSVTLSFRNLRIVKVEQCNKLKFIFSSSMARNLEQLQELEVRECSSMGAIVMNDSGEIEDKDTSLFPKLRRLALERLPKLMGFLITQNPFITDAGEIILEEKLHFHMPILHEQVVFPILERLELSSVSLAEIEHNQHPRGSSFRLSNMQATSRFGNLSFLEVKGSSKTKFLLPLSTARFMVHLKHLHVLECKVVEEILVTEELVIPEVSFPQLECMWLENLPFLKRFCTGSNIKFPSLKNLRVEHCPQLMTFIFKPASPGMKVCKQLEEMTAEEGPHSAMQPFSNEEVVFPIVKTLKLSSVNLVEIEQNQHPKRSSCILRNTQATSRFENLLRLKVKGIGNIKYILPFSIARFMVQLEHLHVIECEAMEEILVVEELGVQDEIIPEVLFPRLELLHLEDLPILKRFCFGSNIEFPSLKELKIVNCTKVEKFISNSLSSDLTIKNELKEKSAEETPHFVMQPFFSEEVVFPILESLTLTSVNLVEIEQNQHPERSSCILRNSQATSRFENLLHLVVQGIGNIKYILPFSIARFMVQLKHLYVIECEAMEEILVVEESGVKDEITPEVLFPRLESLCLVDLPILKRFCFGSNIEFPSLKDLAIVNCPKVEKFISNSLSSNMTIKNELKERSAEETSYSVMQPFFNEEVVFPIVEKLRLSSVNLVEIEQNQHPERSSCILRNSQAMPRFENLSYLKVQGIGNIKYILPFSIARFMVQLKSLYVLKCEVMEEILVVEESGVKDEITPEVLFPRLESLQLVDLPILKRFCFGSNIEFPSLKDLAIVKCPKVEAFVSKSPSSDMTINKELKERSAEETPHFVIQPFITEEATFPKLENMQLGDYDTIWHGQFLEECFCKLKVLRLLCNHNEADVSPPNFVKRLHNLEELVVHHSYWEEIFPYEELLDQEKHVGILTQLRELDLYFLPKLTQLWNEDTQPCPIFHNLKVLKVSKCEKLKILVPSSVSFQNLSRLEIRKCHGLINLVTSSTAKSLVQLKKLSVSECKTITEIVRGDGGEGNDQVITFSKLTSLKLDCLPQLSNFCSGGYSFEFPSLEEVIVSQCQEMKIFSDGVLSTPKLKRVQATKEDGGHWKDDLNSTIHWLWESKPCIPPSIDCSEKEVQNSKEDKDHP